MKVFFDHQIFLTQRVGGVSRYFYNLKKNLVENKFCEVDDWSFIYRNYYPGKGHGAIYLQPFGIKKIDGLISSSTSFRYLGAINNFVALNRFKRNDCDLIHVTADDSAYLTSSPLNKPIVATVHDLIAELYPSHFPEIKSWLKQRENTFRKADHLICISESTKRDLKDIYGISDDKISMIYHGPADYLVKDRPYLFINDHTQQPQQYVLYVGDRKTPYKNFSAMVENLAPVLKENGELKLLCVGSTFTTAELEKFRRLGIPNAVTSVQAADNELFSIYENAACLILPSLYEGFGFPLLEAMKAGCPVLSSNSSSLPEVGGDGALYFHPVSFDGFKDQLELILHDNDVRRELLQEQLKVLPKFSWRKTADKTYQAYRRLI